MEGPASAPCGGNAAEGVGTERCGCAGLPRGIGSRRVGLLVAGSPAAGLMAKPTTLPRPSLSRGAVSTRHFLVSASLHGECEWSSPLCLLAAMGKLGPPCPLFRNKQAVVAFKCLTHYRGFVTDVSGPLGSHMYKSWPFVGSEVPPRAMTPPRFLGFV